MVLFVTLKDGNGKLEVQSGGRRINDFSSLLPKEYCKACLHFSSFFLNPNHLRPLQQVRLDRGTFAGEELHTGHRGEKFK